MEILENEDKEIYRQGPAPVCRDNSSRHEGDGLATVSVKVCQNIADRYYQLTEEKLPSGCPCFSYTEVKTMNDTCEKLKDKCDKIPIPNSLYGINYNIIRKGYNVSYDAVETGWDYIFRFCSKSATNMNPSDSDDTFIEIDDISEGEIQRCQHILKSFPL